MQNIYECFEFNKIKEAINEFSKTEIAKEKLSSLMMLASIDEVNESLLDLSEMSSIIFRFGPLPISNSASALKIIDMAKKAGILTPRDLNLLANDVNTAKDLALYLKKIDVSYPRIQSKINGFIDLTNLEKEIHRVITNSLTVDDKASEKLHEIRNKIRKLEREQETKAASLAYTYASFLSDENPTIRDGHFVLPVKTSLKSKVIGAIYDVSDTGNTTFIEPLEIITLNNQITSLRVEENDEVRKILKQLTNIVLLEEKEIIHNNLIIGELDFISSKALYMIATDSVIATISKKEKVVDLVNAKHPLIEKERVIANSYHIDEDKRYVIISGPNAGGKTVSLKVVGLLVLMNQCGLPLPCQKATLSYFDHIYVDIGDNQSLSSNLSTFSAHMSHIGEITSLVKGNDLVLLDELGTGTDPKEGEAIALAVINKLILSHSLGMISSHFSSLKEYALTHDHLENSSMIFNEEELKPTYIFKNGVPGKSYGLEVAERYGVPNKIINDAKEYIEHNGNAKSDELILILQKKVEESTRLLDKLNKEKIELEKEANRIRVDAKNLEEKRNKLLSSVKEEKEDLINDAKEKIDEILKELSNGNNKLNDIIMLKKKVESLEENEEVETFNEEIKEGDSISIPSLELYAKVERINGKKAKIRTDSGISLDVDISRLHKESDIISTPINKVSKHVEIDNRIVPIELNIIGLHVDEAKDKLMRYIDDARVKHFKKVRIIHGFGSGALRKMTHEYLSKQKDLTYQLAEGYEGGGGATTVIFNDR